MKKITFKKDSNPESFSSRLTKEVNEYFKGKSKKGTKVLYIKTFVIFTLLILSYSTALINSNLLLFGVTGALVALVGFNVMHDASHGSYSNNKTLNAILAEIGASWMGGNRQFWHEKHDIMHHSYTNIVDADHDISKTPMFRFAPSHEKKWFHRYQQFYCWPLYMFMTLYWFYYDDFVVYKTKRIGEHSFNMSSNDKIRFWIGKTIHVGLFVIPPIVLLGWKGILGIFILHAVAGVFLALVFQMAHVVEGVNFYVIPENGEIEDNWHLLEVQTTADFASNNWLWTILLGGLNYQIEHHLFRDISHIHYPAVSKIVKRICNEMGIRYTSFPTFSAAIASHYRHLKYLGK